MISIIRVVTLSKLDRSDTTYDVAIVAYWGAVEVNLPIICACLTTIRPLLNRLFPGLLGPRTSQYKGASLALSSQPPLQVAGDPVTIAEAGRSREDCEPSSSFAEAGRFREDGEQSSSSGESLVIMRPEVDAYGCGLGVEPPPRAHAGRSGLKSDLPFSLHTDRV